MATKITLFAAASATVANSTVVIVDVELSNLGNGAQFEIQCSSTATLTLCNDVTSLSWPAANNMSDNATFTNHTVSATVSSPGTIVIEVDGNPGAPEKWQIRAFAPAPSNFAVMALANAQFQRVVAEPQMTLPLVT